MNVLHQHFFIFQIHIVKMNIVIIHEIVLLLCFDLFSIFEDGIVINVADTSAKLI